VQIRCRAAAVIGKAPGPKKPLRTVLSRIACGKVVQGRLSRKPEDLPAEFCFDASATSIRQQFAVRLFGLMPP
jgi:hypothetical protein